MKYVSSTFFLILLILSPSFADASYTFNSNLKLGDQGSEVLELQKALNSLSNIQIASYGSGSPGFETNFFGILTHQAVVEFQNMYAKDVLYPIGLASGTGYVGSLTRTKLNALLQNIAQPKDISIFPEENEDLGVPEEDDNNVVRDLNPETFTLRDPAAFAKGGSLEDIFDIGEIVDSLMEDLLGELIDLSGINDFLDGIDLGVGGVSIAGTGRPFGGRVLYSLRCNCSTGYWLIIGPPKGGKFHFISQDYREYTLPRVGVWTVGLHYPGGRCRIVTGDSCTTLPTDGKIDGFVGSSK